VSCKRLHRSGIVDLNTGAERLNTPYRREKRGKEMGGFFLRRDKRKKGGRDGEGTRTKLRLTTQAKHSVN